MDFDFSKYPYRNDYELEKIEKATETVYPQGYGGGEIIFGKNADRITFDFGEEYVGRISFDIKGAGKIKIEYGEVKDEIAERERKFAHWYESPVDTVNADGNGYKNVTIDGRRALRYLKITLTEGQVTVKNVKFDTITAKKAFDGYFKCSDEKVNRIFDISKRTLSLCMQDYFEDGVKRDGLLWISDARIAILGDYMLFGNTDIVRNAIKLFLRSMRADGWMPTNAIIGGAEKHPSEIDYMFDYVGGKKPTGTPGFYNSCGEIFYASYAADFVGLVCDYYEYTGDGDFIGGIINKVHAVVKHLCETVKFDVKGKLLPERVMKIRKFYDTVNDESTYYFLLVYVLKSYYKMLCDLSFDLKCGDVFEYIIEFGAKAEEYFDKDKTVISYRESKGENAYPYSGQTYGYLSGLMGEKKIAAKNFRKLLSDPNGAYPISGHAKFWFLRGLFECGEYETAFNWLKKEWGVLVDEGASACYENWDSDFMSDFKDDNRSYCHSWSSAPARFLPEYILGVKFLGKGCKHVRIEPHLCGLDFAEGEVPTPYGAIYVKAEGEKVTYKLPKEIKLVGATKDIKNKIRLYAFTPPVETFKGYETYARCGYDFAITDPSYPFGSQEYLSLFDFAQTTGVCVMPGATDHVGGMDLKYCSFPRPYDKTDYNVIPSFVGVMLRDEPESPEYNLLVERIRKFEYLYGPDKTIYINHSVCYCDRSMIDKYPLDSEGYGHDLSRATVYNFSEKILDNIHGEKILSFDYYPLLEENGKPVLKHDYLYAFDICAFVAKEKGYTLFDYVQTCYMTPTEFGEHRALTSPEDYRFQCGVSLAYGARGIGSFCYRPAFKGWITLVDERGNPTDIYRYVQKVNRELNAFSPVYMEYEWQAAGLNLCADPKEYSLTCIKRMIHNVTDYKRIGIEKTETDIVVGEFTRGNDYAYLLINYVEPSEKGKNALRLKLKGNAEKIIAWDKGERREIYSNGEYIDIVLDNGDFVFLQIL